MFNRKCRLSLAVMPIVAVFALSSSTATASQRASTSSAVATATATLKTLEHRPTTFSVPAIPSKPPPGKTIDVVACGLPICQSYANAVKVAAAAVGWTSTTLQGGLTPQTVAAAYNQAVRNKPVGVLGLGAFSPTLFSQQLKELAAEHVPVVLPEVTPDNVPGITWVPEGAPLQRQLGTELADYVLSDSKGKDIHAAIFTTTATPIFALAHAPFTSTIKNACASCTVSTFEFPEADIGTTLPTEVITYLTSHPNVNYLFFDFNNEVDGVPAALKSAGLSSRVKIFTEDTSPTETAYIAAGQEAVAAELPNFESYWASVNLFIRSAMKLPLGPAEDIKLPNWVLTKSNIPSTTKAFPMVANYQNIYKAAWHES